MNYVTLADQEGVVHVMWCGMISDDNLALWKATVTYRWCACEEHIMGTITENEQMPTCLQCIGHFHEYAVSRYGLA